MALASWGSLNQRLNEDMPSLSAVRFNKALMNHLII